MGQLLTRILPPSLPYSPFRLPVVGHEDEGKPSKCSTCANTIRGKRYKCLSCPKFELCRSCYSQVHEIHPSHVFLEVLYDKDSAGSRSETDSNANGPSYPNGNANGHAHDATAEDEAEPCTCST
jgi:hypothetical protein